MPARLRQVWSWIPRRERNGVLVGAAIAGVLGVIGPMSVSTPMMGRHSTDGAGRRWYVEGQAKASRYLSVDWKREVSVAMVTSPAGGACVPPLTWDPHPINALTVPNEPAAFGSIRRAMLDTAQAGKPVSRVEFCWAGLVLMALVPVLAAGAIVLIFAFSSRFNLAWRADRRFCQRCGYPMVRQSTGALLCPECGP